MIRASATADPAIVSLSGVTDDMDWDYLFKAAGQPTSDCKLRASSSSAELLTYDGARVIARAFIGDDGTTALIDLSNSSTRRPL
jgi:hypothetical protein